MSECELIVFREFQTFLIFISSIIYVFIIGKVVSKILDGGLIY
jgi:hypothetical protein